MKKTFLYNLLLNVPYVLVSILICPFIMLWLFCVFYHKYFSKCMDYIIDKYNKYNKYLVLHYCDLSNADAIDLVDQGFTKQEANRIILNIIRKKNVDC